MIRKLTFLVTLFVSVSCNANSATENIEVDNIVYNCIAFNKIDVQSQFNVLILNTNLDIKSNVGECGCKSAALKYDVKIGNGKIISLGVFSSVGKKKFSFVINSDSSLYKKSRLKLSINCN